MKHGKEEIFISILIRTLIDLNNIDIMFSKFYLY